MNNKWCIILLKKEKEVCAGHGDFGKNFYIHEDLLTSIHKRKTGLSALHKGLSTIVDLVSYK